MPNQHSYYLNQAEFSHLESVRIKLDVYTDVKIILMTETIKYPDGMMGESSRNSDKGGRKVNVEEWLGADNQLGTAIGIIYDSSDAYSTGIYTAFVATAEELGLNIVAQPSFTADNKSDLSTQVAQCQDAGADLVFLPIYYNEASQILIAANSRGYEPTFFGCDGMDGILSVEGFDTSLANGLMMLCPFSAFGDDETTTTFVSAYEAAFDSTPNQFAADAYDCVYAIYQCVQDGTINGDMSASDMCDALVEAFGTMSFSGTTGENQTWDENGMISKEPKVYQIQDDAYVLVGKE